MIGGVKGHYRDSDKVVEKSGGESLNGFPGNMMFINYSALD